MIITGPTGLYASVLPKTPDDSTSVVYTIGNVTPPRANIDFQPISYGVERELRPSRTHDDQVRRAAVGDLIFKSKASETVKVKSGISSYKIGQILEFEQTNSAEIVAATYTSDLTTRHNNYRIDSTVVNNQTQSQVSQEALKVQDTLNAQLVALKNQYLELQNELVADNARLCEVNKVINGLNVVLEVHWTQANEDLRKQLIQEATVIQEGMALKVEQINALPAQIQTLTDKIESVSILVQ